MTSRLPALPKQSLEVLELIIKQYVTRFQNPLPTTSNGQAWKWVCKSLILNHFQTSTTSTPKGVLAALEVASQTPWGADGIGKRMKKKTDHMLATYETSDGTWNIQLSSRSGDSWGWFDGPYESREAAQFRAKVIAEEEGYHFDE